jgi:hypothetical protein
VEITGGNECIAAIVVAKRMPCPGRPMAPTYINMIDPRCSNLDTEAMVCCDSPPSSSHRLPLLHQQPCHIATVQYCPMQFSTTKYAHSPFYTPSHTRTYTYTPQKNAPTYYRSQYPPHNNPKRLSPPNITTQKHRIETLAQSERLVSSKQGRHEISGTCRKPNLSFSLSFLRVHVGSAEATCSAVKECGLGGRRLPIGSYIEHVGVWVWGG